MKLTQCFVDESIHDSLGLAVTAFIFTDSEFTGSVRRLLCQCGINSPHEEFKSSFRMDSNPRMRKARDKLILLTASNAKIAVLFGPFSRKTIGHQSLQALQSILIRNAIPPTSVTIHFDQEIFPSHPEAERLTNLFHYLKSCKIKATENSHRCVGIQAADVIAHCFGQIIKAAISGQNKHIDIGGADTGYIKGTMGTLDNMLLMKLRSALFTRPITSNGENYNSLCDPIILDPENDDPVNFNQSSTLIGWGVQVAPEADHELRMAVERSLGLLWMGCIH